MASAFVVFVAAFLLAPGVILSLPPGPNKKWVFGGQVTWVNAAVHAAVIAAVVFFLGQ
jgi:hypothetical protein